MKKNLFMVAAVALVALVSCNKETDNSVQSVPVSDITFEAEIVQTKTAIGEADSEGNRNVTWVLGDQVNINGTLFTATGYKEDGKAIFKTENLDFATAEVYNAIYPATAGSSLEAVTISANPDGTFANAGVAVAQSENRSLAFMNVASMIKFQVPADYASVTIESTANLAGTVSVSFDENGTPVIGEVKDASKVITLENVKADVDYYVAVLPGSHKFTVRLDGYLSKASTKTLSIARAEMINLQDFPAPVLGTYKLMGLNGDWTNGTKFYKDTDGFLLKNVVLTASSEFKFCQEGGSWGRAISLVKGKWVFTYPGDGNLKMAAGTYDIWASVANDAICIVDAGSAKPAFTSANKQLHILVEGDGEQGLYMWNPSVSGYNNWDSAWKNYNGQVKIDQSSNKYTDYYYYQLPVEANDKTCEFITKWYGGQSMNYKKQISTDLPFWKNKDSDGSYSLSSKINIK